MKDLTLTNRKPSLLTAVGGAEELGIAVPGTAAHHPQIIGGGVGATIAGIARVAADAILYISRSSSHPLPASRRLRSWQQDCTLHCHSGRETHAAGRCHVFFRTWRILWTGREPAFRELAILAA